MGTIEVTDLNGLGPYIYRVHHMHMHGPSEHRFDGVQEDLEIHIVHELIDGPPGWKDYKEKLAVVGVLFKADETSHRFIQKLRPQDFGHIDRINFAELLGSLETSSEEESQKKLKECEFYHYKGSLTNPPCADVVNWIVYKHVLPISEEDLNALREVWFNNLGYGNFRECQPLSGRRVVRNFE